LQLGKIDAATKKIATIAKLFVFIIVIDLV